MTVITGKNVLLLASAASVALASAAGTVGTTGSGRWTRRDVVPGSPTEDGGRRIWPRREGGLILLHTLRGGSDEEGGGSYQDYFFDGPEDGDINSKSMMFTSRSNNNNNMVVSVIPDAILPSAISGMSLLAFQHAATSTGASGGGSPESYPPSAAADSATSGETIPTKDGDDADGDNRLTAPPPPRPPPPHYRPASSSDIDIPRFGPDARPSWSSLPTTTMASLHVMMVVEGGGSADDLAMRSARLVAFRNRAVTAVAVGAILGLVSYYFQEDGLVALCLVLQCLMYQETTKVIGGQLKNPVLKWWWFGTAVVALDGPRFLPWMKDACDAAAFGMAAVGVMGTILRMQATDGTPSDFRDLLRQGAVSLLGTILVVWPSSFWVGTLQDHGLWWVLVPALYVVLNDTFAYLGGVAMGRHKLLPVISPSKTWEGFLVAMAVTVGVAWSVGTFPQKLLPSGAVTSWYPLNKTDGLVLAAFASLVAPFGGFLASFIKRAYGQKDYGSLLPGHGGVVDRLDCQLFLAPFVYLYLTLHKFRK
jgi:phosphatidate cytidylyltransferase